MTAPDGSGHRMCGQTNLEGQFLEGRALLLEINTHQAFALCLYIVLLQILPLGGAKKPFSCTEDVPEG